MYILLDANASPIFFSASSRNMHIMPYTSFLRLKLTACIQQEKNNTLGSDMSDFHFISMSWWSGRAIRFSNFQCRNVLLIKQELTMLVLGAVGMFGYLVSCSACLFFSNRDLPILTVILSQRAIILKQPTSQHHFHVCPSAIYLVIMQNIYSNDYVSYKRSLQQNLTR